MKHRVMKRGARRTGPLNVLFSTTSGLSLITGPEEKRSANLDKAVRA